MVAIVSGNSLGLSLTSFATLGQRGLLGTSGQGRNGEQGYVNVSNGNLILQDFDDRLDARGLDITAVRTYNSQGTLTDDNGDNWAVGAAAQRVQLTGTVATAGSTLLRTDGDGARATYAWDATKNLYVSSAGAGAFDSIAYDAAGARFVWTDGATGLVERYESSGSGRLTSSADPFGNTLTYGYNANGTLQSITDANGEVTYFDYTGTNLTQIRTVTADNTAVTRVRYAYDSANRLSSVTVDLSPADNSIADGKTYVTTYTYDGTSKRVASVSQSDGSSQTFTYVLVGSSYRVASVADGLGRVTNYSYDTTNSRTTVTDPMGLSTVYTYDASGQLTVITSPVAAGVSQTTSFSYTANGDVARVVDSGGHALDMQYDGRGNQILQRDAAGNTLTRTFDVRNQLLTETVYLTPDPDGSGTALPANGLTTRYVYNGAQLRFAISAEGRVTEYRYNSYGQRTSNITYAGGAYAVSGLGATAVPSEAQMATWVIAQNLSLSTRSDMSYNVRGQLQQSVSFSKVDASGNGISDGSQSVTQYVYDRAGLLLSNVSATAGQTQYVYDGLGRLLSSQNALNQVTLTSYDDANGKTTVTLANGLITTRSYDRNGRLLSVRESSTQSANLGETLNAYDKDGRLYLQTDPTGARTVWLYDELGRVSAEIDAQGRLTEYKYNADNLLAQKIVYASPVTASALDTVVAGLAAGAQSVATSALGTLRPATSSADQRSWRIYDSAERLVRTVGANGTVVDTAYDGASRITSVTQYKATVATTSLGAVATLAATAPTGDTAADRVARSFYDADGLLRGSLDAEGYLTELRYDSAGRLSSQISYATVTTASLRATGTLAQLIPATAAIDMVSRWLYDAQGRISGQIDAEGYLTERVYDTAGNVTQTVRYATRVDPTLLSQISSATTVASLRPVSQSEDQATAIVYDLLNRMTQQTNSEGAITQYVYDAVGHVVRTVLAASTSQARTLTSRYDLQGRLVGELSAQGSALLVAGMTQSAIDAVWAQYGLTHTYDAAGRRTSTTDAYVNKTLFFYDRDSRLTHTVNALGEVSENQYNTLGQLTAKVVYGSRISLTGLVGGLVSTALTTAVNAVRNSALDTKTTYTYTLAGAVDVQTDTLGNTTQSTYNAFGERTVIDQLIGAGRHLIQTNTLDRRGLVTGTVLDASGVNATTSAIYDAFGRQTRAVDANGNIRQQAYDRLGRAVTTTDPLNNQRSTSYDAFGRVLTQTDALGKITTYAYNKALRSVTVKTPENISVTTVHTLHGQTQSVVDGLGQTTNFSYDLNGNLVTTTTPLTTATNTYDRAGRLSQSTDANGNVVTLTYDAASRVLTRAVDPTGLNLVTTYQYDSKGRQITVTNPNGKVTQFTYDLKGQLTSEVLDAAGLNLITQYTFDGRGKTLTVISPQGTLTTHTYDNVGRRLQTSIGSTGTALRTTSYAYDKSGNVITATDAASNVTRYVYDAADRLVFTLGPLGQLTRNVYDAENRIVKTVAYVAPISVAGLTAAPTLAQIEATVAVNALDLIEHRVLDRDGRLVATVNGLGEVVKFTYDASGHVIDRTAFANRITLSAWTVGTMPAPTADSTRDLRLRTVYDALGRATFTIDGTGAVVKQVYDGNGNVTERLAYATVVPVATAATSAALTTAVALVANSARDARERFVYDRADRVTLRADGVGAVTRMLYDGNGNVTKTVAYATAIGASAALTTVVASADDRITDYVYDAANRRTYVVDALGATTKFVYDKNGNVVTRYAFAGRVSVPTAATQRTAAALEAVLVYDYSGADRVERSIYDAADRRILAVDATGAVVETQYDTLNNPIRTIAYANRIVLTSFGASGVATQSQVTALLTANSASDRVTKQTFDASQRLIYTVDALGYVTRRTYDGVGRITQTLAYGLSIASTVANTTAAVAAAVAAQSTVDRTTTLAYDAAGRLASATDPLGAVERYGYNGLGEKTSYTNKKGSVWTYAYDAAGHLTQETAPAVDLTTLTQSTGGTMGSLSISATAGVGIVTRLAYDALGNLTTRTEAYGRPEQRATTYGYDAVGNQNTITYASVNVYDTADNPLAVDANGLSARTERASQRITEVTYNVFGEAVRNRDRDGTVTANDAYTFKTYDVGGNVRQEVDALGYVTGYTRNAWGEVTELLRFAKATTLVTATPPTALTVAQVSAAVNAAGIDHGGDRIITTEYDRSGRAVKVREPQVYVYDSSAAAAAQYATARATTVSSYNAFGEVVQVAKLANSVNNVWRYTQHYYDLRGAEVATVDPMGYLTKKTYLAGGELETRTEFATKIAAWNPAAPTTAVPTTTTSLDDRTTAWTYDKGGRKITETRRQVEFSTTANATAATSQRADLTTTYGYDAVDNLTRTTDASGASTYSYYDALGRVTAVVSPPVGTSTVAPVTRFLRDAYGNVVAKIETQQTGAGSSPAWSTTINTTATDPNRDRVTYTRYDVMGNAVQSTDAGGYNHYRSYDARGHVAKEWQGVADSANVTSTLFRVYQYDKLGQQTAIIDPASTTKVSGTTITTVTQAAAGTTTTALEYNGFGELTRKGIAGGRQEYFNYDNAGRIWRTNTDGGVDKGALYNLLGQQTAAVQNAGAGFGAQDVRTFATVDQMGSATDLRRTDMLYDALGNITESRGPERAETQAGAWATRLYSRATLVSSASFLDESGNQWSGANSVTVSWSSLSNLGSGDIKVAIEYASLAIGSVGNESGNSLSAVPGGGIKTHSEVISTSILSSTQATLSWTDPAGANGGIDRVTRITIYKKDVKGNWQPVIDQASNGYSGHAIEVAAPDNPDSQVQLQIRPAGSSGDTGWAAVSLVNFGSALRFNASGLAAGNYEYRVTTTPPNGAPRITATGTIGLTAPPLSAISTPLSTQLYPNTASTAIMNWISPGSAVEQTFRVRLVGSTGAWETRAVSAQVNGKDGASVVGLANGTYEYELLWAHAGENSPYAHATGRITITAAQPSYYVPAVNLPQLAVSSMVVVTGTTPTGTDESGNPIYATDATGNIIGAVYKPALKWPIGAAGTQTVFSYRLQGSSTWINLPTVEFGTGTTESGQVSGTRRADLSSLAAGAYEYRIVQSLNNSPVAQATGQLVVSAPAAGHYESYQVAVQVPVTITPANPAQYIVGWTGTGGTYGPPVVTGYDSVGNPIFGQGYGRDIVGYSESNAPIYGPVRAIPYNTYRTEMVTRSVPVQVQVGTDPVYARDEAGNIQYQTVYETQNQTRTVPVYAYQSVPRTEYYWENVQVRVVTSHDEDGQPIYGYTWTSVQRSRTVYDWKQVQTGWAQETYQVQVPVQRPIITGYAPRYETQYQNQQVAVVVATLVTPADPAQFLISSHSGLPIYGAPVVVGRDESNNPIYGPGYSVVNGAVVATPYVVNQTQWETRQVWRNGLVSAPSIVDTTPVYVPGRTVAAVPTQYSLTSTTAANSASVSQPTAGGASAQVAGVNGYNAGVRPTVMQTFDRWGNTLSVSDPRAAQWKTTYKYNFNSQLIEQRQPDAAGNASAASPVTQIFYDQMGRQVAVKDANGNLNRQEFDSLGNLLKEVHADTGVVQHRYNVFGDEIGTTDAMNKATAFTYDNLGRLLQTQRASVQVYTTNAAGSAAVFVESRAILETNTWDAAGRKLTQKNGTNTETITYTYDLRGNVVRTTQPLGQSVKVAYDTQGNKIGELDAAGHLATWTYDYFGQLQSHTDFGGKAYTYTYDNARQLISSTGVVRSYTYDKAGQLIKTVDGATGKEARYAYDLAGNKLREYLKVGDNVYQDNHMAYDTLGRMRWVSDGRALLNIEYDKLGNRTRIQTHVLTGDTSLDSDLYFKYDAMNRQTVVNAVDAAGNLGSKGHAITYDKNGNRVSDTWYGNKVATTNSQSQITGYDEQGAAIYSTAPTTYVVSQGYTTEVYRYDGLNRLTGVVRDGVQTDYRLYDGASRVIQTGPAGSLPQGYINALNGTSWSGEALAGTGSETRVNRYNANGQILSQAVYKSDNTVKYRVNYENAGGYDATGNLLGYTVNDYASGRLSTYVNEYEWGETARQKKVTATSNQTTPGSTTWGYDGSGQLTSVTDSTLQANNRTFVNDMGGTALYVAQGTHVQRQLVVDGEVLGRYGEIRNAVNPTAQNGVQNFQTSAQFNFGYQPVDGNYPSSSPGTYAVAQGDTLQGIARGAYGDESLWYLIAEANGLSGNADLKAGQVLTVPTRVSSANNAATFKPYDPSAVVGDTTPNMPVPKPKSSGWGFFGKLLMVVVAVVVAYFTAGALAGPMSAALGGSTTAGAVAAGAVGGAVGSIASQGVGVAIGAQDSFSWKGVALSAIGGGVAAGVGGVNFTGADAAAGGVSSIGNRIVQSAIGSALTQGVAVATGLQSSFSWKSVAISALSAGAAKGMNAAMGYDPMTQGFDLGKSLVSGVGASVMVSAARGGRFDTAQIATDAFGNIIGDSLAWANSSANPSGSNYANQMDRGVQGFGNAMGDSVAAANGQSSGVPGPIGSDERLKIMGMFDDGPSSNLVALLDGTSINAAENMRRINLTRGSVYASNGIADPTQPVVMSDAGENARVAPWDRVDDGEGGAFYQRGYQSDSGSPGALPTITVEARDTLPGVEADTAQTFGKFINPNDSALYNPNWQADVVRYTLNDAIAQAAERNTRKLTPWDGRPSSPTANLDAAANKIDSLKNPFGSAGYLLARGAGSTESTASMMAVVGALGGDLLTLRPSPGTRTAGAARGGPLEVKMPKVFDDPTLSASERAYLGRELAIKQRALDRAAANGELTWSPSTAAVRISNLQDQYRQEVAARYLRRFGVEADLSRLNADHPVDLVVGGRVDQRLKMLDSSINKSVGASLYQAGRAAGLKPGDPIPSILFIPRK